MNDAKMTYQEFKNEMQSLLSKSFQYTPSQIGHKEFINKMADLAERFPEYDEMLEEESA